MYSNQDETAKKARRIAAIIYILVLAFIVGGSWFHQNRLAELQIEQGQQPFVLQKSNND